MGPRPTNAHGPQRHFATLVGLTALAATAGSVGLGASPALAARTPDGTAPTTIIVEKTAWGPILALSGGWTLYRLTSDGNFKSTCSGACAQAWPPALLAPGQKEPIGKGVNHLGFLNRSGGKRQVTYEGIPLYRFVADKKAGEINGNVKDEFGQWWVVNPAHPKAKPVKSGSPPPSGVAY
jgi:predicted lipoprotein with Yx(FWY)xxD motif